MDSIFTRSTFSKVLLFLSITLNGYLYYQLKNKIPKEQATTQKKTTSNFYVANKSKSQKSNTSQGSFQKSASSSPKRPDFQNDRAIEEESFKDEKSPNFYDYDEALDNTKRLLSNFQERELNLSYAQMDEVQKIISQSNEAIQNYITEKIKKHQEKYGKNTTYWYDPYDQQFMAGQKIKAREKLKTLMGQEKLERFLEFIQRMNGGEVESMDKNTSYTPIDI